MKQKIEWYREVLALEPNSRVFFSLARLESEDGQISAAIATLREGLQRHPDHVEARLFLVDLLFSSNQHDDLWGEVDHVSSMLGGYPGFWSAWSERLAASGTSSNSQDASLALSFLAACLQGKSISWSEVIASGLRNILPGIGNVGTNLNNDNSSSDSLTARSSSISSVPTPQVHAPCDDSSACQLDEVLSSFATPVQKNEEEEHDEDGTTASPLSMSDIDKLAIDKLASANLGAAESDDEELDSEEPFSLRTRSMADILMEQGDFEGAREIYQELLTTSPGLDERAEIETQLTELKARMSVPQELTPQAHDEDLIIGTGKNRLLDVLESLAQRLEARI